MSHWENQIIEGQYLFYRHGIYYHIFFFHQLCTLWFIFCFSNKLGKWDLKYSLIADIISVYTHFMVRTKYDGLEGVVKCFQQPFLPKLHPHLAVVQHDVTTGLDLTLLDLRLFFAPHCKFTGTPACHINCGN